MTLFRKKPNTPPATIESATMALIGASSAMMQVHADRMAKTLNTPTAR